MNHCLWRAKKKYTWFRLCENIGIIYSWIHSLRIMLCTHAQISPSSQVCFIIQVWESYGEEHTRSALCVIGWECLHRSCLSHISNAAEINTLGIQMVMLDVVADDYVSIDGRFFVWTICLFICLYVRLVGSHIPTTQFNWVQKININCVNFSLANNCMDQMSGGHCPWFHCVMNHKSSCLLSIDIQNDDIKFLSSLWRYIKRSEKKEQNHRICNGVYPTVNSLVLCFLIFFYLIFALIFIARTAHTLPCKYATVCTIQFPRMTFVCFNHSK